MDKEQERRLKAYLESQIGVFYPDRIKGCDRTQRLTRAFLEREGLDIEAELAALEERGGHCDCEILFNTGLAGDPCPSGPSRRGESS